MAAARLLPGLTLREVHLVVSDVDRSVAWYGQALGLRVHSQEPGSAVLGDGDEPLLVLHEDPEAKPAGRHAGLFHFALLYPSRAELARAAIRLAVTRTPITGASDHETHEALYLRDPDHNGIELAVDRPREEWPPSLGYANGPAPLDTDSLLAEVEGEEPSQRIGEGMRMGHLHLHVGDIPEAVAFYRDVLGFGLNADLGTAAFLAAGDYHHHLGVNVWNGQGAGPAPPHTAGLVHWTAELPAGAMAPLRQRLDAAGVEAEDAFDGFLVRDPWGTALSLRPAP